MGFSPVSILYVCTGNICRSPLAEAQLRQYAARRGVAGRLDIASAGTHAWEGNAATPEAQEAARRWGLDLSGHRARAVRESILRKSDIVLAAAREHQEWLLREFPGHENAIYLARLFPRRLRAEPPAETDIPDPIGKAVEYYAEVLRLLEPTLPDIISGVLEDVTPEGAK